jgi:hypothetical protein
MTVIVGSATVPSNSTVAVFSLPPGYSNSVIYQVNNPQAVYIGTSPRVSPVNGMPVPVTPLNQETYTGSANATIYATTGNATASSFSYIISTTGLA